MFSGLPHGGWRLIGWALLVLLLAGGCTRREPSPPPAPKTAADWFAIRVGDRMVQMQLAVHESEMERGLMGRRELARDRGMLFVYRQPSPMSFWMRNTPLPLDIGFFNAAGELQEIYGLLPFDETPVRSRSAQVQFALEMNRGWFHDNGVRPGARLDLAAVREALSARALPPAVFGLP